MKFIFSILFSVVFISGAFAQGSREDRIKKIDALKAAFITKKLDLTPEESQQFWPVYNEYQHELGVLYRQKRQQQMSSKQSGGQRSLTGDLDFDTKILNVKKKYRKEFSQVLPPQKVMALTQAEREFKDELIKELGERKKQH